MAQRRRAERVRRSRRAVAEEPTADQEANADATELVEEVAAEAQETAAVDAPAPETEEDAQAPETEEEEE